MKLIMVRIHDGTLVTAKCVAYESESGMVELADEVELEAGKRVTEVPKEYCYEFNPDMQILINTLRNTASYHTLSANQLMETDLQLAVFDTGGKPMHVH